MLFLCNYLTTHTYHTLRHWLAFTYQFLSFSQEFFYSLLQQFEFSFLSTSLFPILSFNCLSSSSKSLRIGSFSVSLFKTGLSLMPMFSLRFITIFFPPGSGSSLFINDIHYHLTHHRCSSSVIKRAIMSFLALTCVSKSQICSFAILLCSAVSTDISSNPTLAFSLLIATS